MIGKKWVLLGSVGKPYGLKGWLKINSYTEPASNIFTYQPWHLSPAEDEAALLPIKLLHHQINDQRLIAQFSGYDTPESAQILTNQLIYVPREQLPSLEATSYYWTDLIGLAVYNLAGEHLGEVKALLETGANDVVVIESEPGQKRLLIPFLLKKTIQHIDLKDAKMIVDWDPHF